MIGDYVSGRCTRKIFTKSHPEGIYPEVSGVLVKDNDNGTVLIMMPGGTLECFGPKGLQVIADETLDRTPAMLVLKERRKIIKELLKKQNRQ